MSDGNVARVEINRLVVQKSFECSFYAADGVEIYRSAFFSTGRYDVIETRFRINVPVKLNSKKDPSTTFCIIPSVQPSREGLSLRSDMCVQLASE